MVTQPYFVLVKRLASKINLESLRKLMSLALLIEILLIKNQKGLSFEPQIPKALNRIENTALNIYRGLERPVPCFRLMDTKLYQIPTQINSKQTEKNQFDFP